MAVLVESGIRGSRPRATPRFDNAVHRSVSPARSIFSPSQGFVLERLGLQESGPTGVPANFEECVFRVCPVLQYEATTMTHTLKRNKSMTEEEMQNLLKRCAAAPPRSVVSRRVVRFARVHVSSRSLSQRVVVVFSMLFLLFGRVRSFAPPVVARGPRRRCRRPPHRSATQEKNKNDLMLARLKEQDGTELLYGAKIQLQVRSGSHGSFPGRPSSSSLRNPAAAAARIAPSSATRVTRAHARETCGRERKRRALVLRPCVDARRSF